MPGEQTLQFTLPGLTADFGFYSWPEPGVGAYTEVRDQTEKVEESLGLLHNGSQLVSSSWQHKIPKLLWRGVPMVEVRQVSRHIVN